MNRKPNDCPAEVPPVRDEEMEGLRRVLARALRRERWRQGLPQDEVARRAGLTRPALSQVESGAHDPRTSTFLRIAEALGGVQPVLDYTNRLWLRYRAWLRLPE